jgi:hypothetical protein
MTNVIELERINDNQQIKMTINCVDQEVKTQLLTYINENKNIVDDLELYPMAAAGNKSESEIINVVLSFGVDILETVKDELVGAIVMHLISKLKSKKQEYVVKDKDGIISSESSEDQDES